MKLNNSITKLTVGFAVVFFGFMLSAFSDLPQWTIDGDSVYVDDVNVNIIATPHTITSSGWVTFELTSKVYSGDIDAVWGFDTNTVKPKKAEIYSPYWVNTTKSTSYTFYNVSNFVDSNASCDYGNLYNLNRQEATHTVLINSTWETKSNIVCYDSVEPLGNNDYLVTWTSKFSERELWKTMSGISSIEYDYMDMTRWYFLKSVPIVQNQQYKMRVYVEVPPTLEPKSGKYWFAIKPSAETFSEAIASGHLYVLDPWWNSTFSYSQNIIINSTTSVTDYVTKLSIDTQTLISAGKMNSSCKDMRFTDDISATEFSYWIESGCNTTTTNVWVKGTWDTLNGTQAVMYYGNQNVETTSSSLNVFGQIDSFFQIQSDADLRDILSTTDTAITGTSYSVLDTTSDFSGDNVIYTKQEADATLYSLGVAHNYTSIIDIQFTCFLNSTTGTVAGGRNRCVVSKREGTESAGDFLVQITRVNDTYYSQNFNLWASSGSSQGAASSFISGSVIDNVEHRYQTRYDESTQILQFWRDGTNVENSSLITNTLEATSSNFRIQNEGQNFEDTGAISNIMLSIDGQTLKPMLFLSVEPTFEFETEVSLTVPTLSIIEEPSDPGTYLDSTSYQFNVTACDDDGTSDLSLMTFEWKSSNSTISTNATVNATCLEFYTTKINVAAATYTYKWYVKDSTDSYATTSATYTVQQATGTINSWFVNDTYVPMNNTLLVFVDASNVSSLNFTLQTSGGSKNYTTSWNGTHYTKLLSKTELGSISTNATQLNFTYFWLGGNFTDVSNTSTFGTNYATTVLNSISNTPSSTYNSVDDAVSIYANYSTNEGTVVQTSCIVVISSTNYAMSYVPNRQFVSVSVSGWAADTYSYSINCTNTAYQSRSQTSAGSFQVSEGSGAGGSPTGGGGGGTTYIVQDTEDEVAECGNSICENGETTTSCPLDCKKLGESRVVTAEIAILGASLVGIYFVNQEDQKKKKKKRVKNHSP